MLSLDVFTKADEYVLDLDRFRNELQDFSCPVNAAHAGGGGDICCYKADGNDASAGTCKCGIDKEPEGTCF